MGKEVKEKKESKLVTKPRISSMEVVEYVQGWISQYTAMSRFEDFISDEIESEWDEIVKNIFKTSTPFLQRLIEGLSSIPVFKEKGLDVFSIDLKDYEEFIKKFIHTYDYTANKDIIFRQYIKAFLSRIPLGFHLEWQSSLPLRDREIIALRCAWICKSKYMWDHHIIRGAKQAGISKENIFGLNTKELDKILLSAVDELYSDAILSEKTWISLTQRYNLFQTMDLVFTIGLYIQLATVFNVLKIQNEDIIKEIIKNEDLPSLKRDNDKIKPVIRKIRKTKPTRLDAPRINPLTELEYIKELLNFQNALNRLNYTKSENETEWEKEIESLIQWLKNYILTEINGLSSFLKLEEKGLEINSISLQDYEESIKEFINQTGTIFNLKAIMMRYRKLRLYWIIQASHTTYDSSLPLRDKEILILRIAWLCRAQYEWDHHVIAGRRAGLTDEEINNIRKGLKVKTWQPFDKVLIQSVDELYQDNTISDETWEFLSEQYNMFQLMDLIFTVTSYNLLAMFLNTFGIQTEEFVKDLIKKEKKLEL